jgi:hypothetical protein
LLLKLWCLDKTVNVEIHPWQQVSPWGLFSFAWHFLLVLMTRNVCQFERLDGVLFQFQSREPHATKLSGVNTTRLLSSAFYVSRETLQKVIWLLA